MGKAKDKKIDIFEVRKEIKEGKLRIWVNKYGCIVLEDTETKERACLGNIGD